MRKYSKKVKTAMSTNKYQIWLESEGVKIQLPVNPEIVKISRSGANESVTIANLGETTLIQKSKAPVISFSSFFLQIIFRAVMLKSP